MTEGESDQTAPDSSAQIVEEAPEPITFSVSLPYSMREFSSLSGAEQDGVLERIKGILGTPFFGTDARISILGNVLENLRELLLLESTPGKQKNIIIDIFGNLRFEGIGILCEALGSAPERVAQTILKKIEDALRTIIYAKPYCDHKDEILESLRETIVLSVLGYVSGAGPNVDISTALEILKIFKDERSFDVLLAKFEERSIDGNNREDIMGTIGNLELGEENRARAEEFFARVLADNKWVSLRAQAATQLGKMKAASRMELLQNGLLEDDRVASACRSAIVKIGGKGAVDAFIGAYRSSEIPERKAFILSGFEDLKYPQEEEGQLKYRVTNFLSIVLKESKDAEVATRAAVAMGVVSPPGGIHASEPATSLGRALERGLAERRCVVAALGMTKSFGALEYLRMARRKRKRWRIPKETIDKAIEEVFVANRNSWGTPSGIYESVRAVLTDIGFHWWLVTPRVACRAWKKKQEARKDLTKSVEGGGSFLRTLTGK